MNLNAIVYVVQKIVKLPIKVKLPIWSLYTRSPFFSLDIDVTAFECFITIQKKPPINLLETGSTKAHPIHFKISQPKML